jgi:hypothetical protein
MYMAESSEGIKFSEIADNEITASENIYFTNPILTVTPENSNAINPIWNHDGERRNQVDFDGVDDYISIEEQPIEQKSREDVVKMRKELVQFWSGDTQTNYAPGFVSKSTSNWNRYAVAEDKHNILKSSWYQVGVEWNVQRFDTASTRLYAFIGLRTADDVPLLLPSPNAGDGRVHITYAVQCFCPDGTTDRMGTFKNLNTPTPLQGTEVVNKFDFLGVNPSAKCKMIVNPLTQKVEVYYDDVHHYTFATALTDASYPLKVMCSILNGTLNNIKAIKRGSTMRARYDYSVSPGQYPLPLLPFNNYISDKCWTFNCWIQIPAAQLSTGAKYILAINDEEYTFNSFLVGLKNNPSQLYAYEGGAGNKHYFGTTISAGEWHMLTVSRQPQETRITYDPAYEYHSSNSVYGGNEIGKGGPRPGNTADHGMGRLSSTELHSSWVVHSNDHPTPKPESGELINFPWWQISNHKKMKVLGAITMGRPDGTLTYQHVTNWKFKYSLDNITWTDVDDGAIFIGNTDSFTRVHQTFTTPVFAKHIRFYPQTYFSHASARMALSIAQYDTPGHISVYLDGQKDTGASQGVNDNYISIPRTAKWSIGAEINLFSGGNGTTPVQYFKGSAKEIMIWDKGLSDYEIAALHKLGHSWSGQTNIIEEGSFFTSSRGHNTVNGNSVTAPYKMFSTDENWQGWATTDADSSIVGMTFQLIDTTADVMVGLVANGPSNAGEKHAGFSDEHVWDSVAQVPRPTDKMSLYHGYWWKGWKVYSFGGALEARFNPDGGSDKEDSFQTTLQSVTTQTVKLMINEDTNYPEIYIDNILVHTFTNRTINISDYPFACAVSCKAGGVKNVKVLKRVISQSGHIFQPWKSSIEVFDPEYTHHSTSSTWPSTQPGQQYGKARLADNYGCYFTSGTIWAAASHLSANTTIYWQIDYGANQSLAKTLVGGVVTYGVWDNDSLRVTKWKFQYSTDGSNWLWVDNGKEFEGNIYNSNKRNMVYFNSPVNTTGIRFFPQSCQIAQTSTGARLALLLYTTPNGSSGPLCSITDSNVSNVTVERLVDFHINNPSTSDPPRSEPGGVWNSGNVLSFTNDNIFKSTSIDKPSGFECKVSPNPDSNTYNHIHIGLRVNDSTADPTDNSLKNITYDLYSQQSNTGENIECWYNGVVEHGYLYVDWDVSLQVPSSGNISHMFEMKVDTITQEVKVYYPSTHTALPSNLMYTFNTPLTDSNYPLKVVARVDTGKISHCRALGPQNPPLPLFNGKNYLNLENTFGTTLVGKNTISFSCWFYKKKDSVDGVLYSFNETPTECYSHRISNDGEVAFYITSGKLFSIGNIEHDKWYHYAFTRRGTNYTFYINGENKSVGMSHSVSTIGNYSETSKSYIGFVGDNIPVYGFTSGSWRGKISNIYFWDRTLTDNEIISVYHNFGISKSEFAGKALMDNTIIPNANISISSYFKDKQFQQLPGSPFTFTNCSATGQNGPTLDQCVSEYSDSLTKINMTTQGIQEWTVPKSGVYKISAKGGRGGHGGYFIKLGGLGALIEGIFNLQGGEIIKILVGQKGQETGDQLYTSQTAAGGGGGGTFVLKSPYNSVSSVLIIAGGGGGSNHYGNNSANAAQDINARLPNETGTGGGYDADYSSGGGGGLITDGKGWPLGTGSGGKSFVNEGQGGIGGFNNNSSTHRNYGGFGGGGGNGAHAGGGGGGINGGDGGGDDGDKGGGGGASYNTGESQLSQHHSGSHGEVTITKL